MKSVTSRHVIKEYLIRNIPPVSHEPSSHLVSGFPMTIVLSLSLSLSLVSIVSLAPKFYYFSPILIFNPNQPLHQPAAGLQVIRKLFLVPQDPAGLVSFCDDDSQTSH